MARYCNSCGRELADGVRFCKFCGAQQPEQAPAPAQEKRYCISCGQEITPETVFCPRCGTQAPGEQPAQQQPIYAPMPQQPVYAPPPVYQAAPQPKKKGKGIVAVLLILVVLGGVGWFGFREGGFLRGLLGEKGEKPSEEPAKPSASVSPGKATATPKPTEKPESTPEPTNAPETYGKVSGWQGTFNGMTLPAPETGGTITEWTVKDDSVTVRIDGMSYKEYIAYCRVLEALDGWEVYNDEDTAHFPDDYNQRTKVYFTGVYGDLPHISVQYYSDQQCESSGYPHFCMFIFTDW